MILVNPLVLELNAQCDVQQTGIEMGLHYKGYDRLSAVLIIWRFEHHAA
jgi:hypothetical protein